MAAVDLTNITPPRVPLTDPRTGLISREWYRFFLNMFQLVGGGQNTTSLSDLLVGPPPAQESFAEINSQITGTQLGPQYQDDSGVFAETLQAAQLSSLDTSAAQLQAQLNDVRQELRTQRQPELGTFAALQQDNLPWTTFNTAPSPVPTATGSLYWDGGTTLNLQATPNVLMRLGESEFVYAKASAAITKGQLCYHTGSVGSSGVITAAPTPLALADPNQIVGVAAESIALNGFGLIQISGDLRGFNTTGSSVGETWADGDPLYYNPAYVGGMTKTKPSAPNQKSYIGEVINAGSGGSGSMHIRIVPGSVLGGTDSNVQFGVLANKDLIQYDSGLGYWKNVAVGSLPYQPTAAPATYTADFSVASTDVWIINNKAGSTCTATLPAAAANSGRTLYFQNYQPQALVSASSNVVPVDGGAAGTSILLASDGDQATLVSDGSNWIMTQYIPNNILLLE